MAGRIVFPIINNMKRCTGCMVEKPVPDFQRLKANASSKLLSRCRECRKAACRAWYGLNIETERQRARDRMRVYGPKDRERNKKWALENPVKAREHSRRKLLGKKYNMTIEEHDALFASQGFACAACGADAPNSKKGWSTDHCHLSGKVRGILCHHCNVGIGHAKDNTETLRGWIAYLEKSKEEVPLG